MPVSPEFPSELRSHSTSRKTVDDTTVRGEHDIKARSSGFAFDIQQGADRPCGGCEVQLDPARLQRERLVVEVEQGDGSFRCVSGAGRSYPRTSMRETLRQVRERMAIPGLLVDLEQLLVSDQGAREVIELSQVGTEDEGRASDCPKDELSALFVVCEARLARLAPAGVRRQGPEREHVGIGPVSRSSERSLLRQVVESRQNAIGEITIGLVVGEVPAVPGVIGDAPELSVLADFRGMGELGGAG